MKKLIYSAAVMLLAGTMLSCEKEAQNQDPLDPNIPRVGMTVELDLGIADGDATRNSTKTTTGAYRPDTKFVAGDKIALLFFPSNSATATVLTVREVTITSAHVTAGSVSEMIKDIPTSMTHVKAIMNYNKSNNTISQQAGKVWTIAEFQGKKLSEINIGLIPRTDITKPTGATTAIINYSPHDVFASALVPVTIVAGSSSATVNFVLTRIVSLCRVIIEDKTKDGLVGAFDFTHADNIIMIRKNTSSVSLSGTLGTAYTKDSGSGIAIKGASLTTNTLAGYIGAPLTGMSATKTWKDLVIFPQATNATVKLELLLGIKTKKVLNNPAGGLFPLGSLLYYSGEVNIAANAAIAANKIIGIKVSFDGISGGATTPPLPKEYGDFTAKVTIAGWDTTVIEADTNM